MTPRGLRVVALSVILGGTALLLSGCSWSEALGLGWPHGITPEAHLNRELWIGSVIASLVVGVIVWGLIFWTSAFHRHKKGDTELPRQFGYNMPLELVLTVVPFLIISVLFYFTVVVQERMLHKDPNPEVVIDVTAFQWNWKFGYQKVDFADGTFNYDGADPERKAAVASGPEGLEGAQGGEFGTDLGNIAGKNPEDRTYLNFDKVETLGSSPEIPVLVVPSGKRIEFQLELGRRHPRFLGAGVPVQARRDARPEGEQLRQHLPDQRDQPDRRVRRPLHRDVRHLPLDDELRAARGGAQRLQGVSGAAHRRQDQRRGAGRHRPVADRRHHPSVRHPPRRAWLLRYPRRASRDTTCTSKPGCSSS